MTLIEIDGDEIVFKKLDTADILDLITTTVKAAAGQKFGTWSGK